MYFFLEDHLELVEYVPHDKWKPYLRKLNDKELQNVVANFEYKNGISEKLKKGMLDFQFDKKVQFKKVYIL
jgi:hypothetical protein